jgi:hypothetical protein
MYFIWPSADLRAFMAFTVKILQKWPFGMVRYSMVIYFSSFCGERMD